MRLILATILGATLLVTPAFAQRANAPSGDSRAIPVSYSDLNLTTSEDASALLSRLRQAASAACEAHEISQPSASLRRAIAKCRDDALEVAIAQLEEPELTRLYHARAR